MNTRFSALLIAIVLLPGLVLAQQRVEQIGKEYPFLKNAREIDRSVNKAQLNSYTVPFASRGNTIDLIIANTSSQRIYELEITVQNVPLWIELYPHTFTVEKLPDDAEVTAGFTFHLTKEAPVGAKVNLVFRAKSAEGFSWSKTVALQVATPSKFIVSPNYPNPFSHSTHIYYELPAAMEVTISIFDIIGRKVKTLINARQTAGSHTMKWNANGLASGIYFCRLVAENNASDSQIVEIVKMMLIK